LASTVTGTQDWLGRLVNEVEQANGADIGRMVIARAVLSVIVEKEEEVRKSLDENRQLLKRKEDESNSLQRRLGYLELESNRMMEEMSSAHTIEQPNDRVQIIGLGLVSISITLALVTCANTPVQDRSIEYQLELTILAVGLLMMIIPMFKNGKNQKARSALEELEIERESASAEIRQILEKQALISNEINVLQNQIRQFEAINTCVSR